jgi:hypothetical protein
MSRLIPSAAALFLMAVPAVAQTSYPTTIGSTPAPALGITPGITLGIAAAATANDHTANPPAPVPKGNAHLATNTPAVPLRSATR